MLCLSTCYSNGHTKSIIQVKLKKISQEIPITLLRK
jgi:hypothetical protein